MTEYPMPRRAEDRLLDDLRRAAVLGLLRIEMEAMKLESEVRILRAEEDSRSRTSRVAPWHRNDRAR